MRRCPQTTTAQSHTHNCASGRASTGVKSLSGQDKEASQCRVLLHNREDYPQVHPPTVTVQQGCMEHSSTAQEDEHAQLHIPTNMRGTDTSYAQNPRASSIDWHIAWTSVYHHDASNPQKDLTHQYMGQPYPTGQEPQIYKTRPSISSSRDQARHGWPKILQTPWIRWITSRPHPTRREMDGRSTTPDVFVFPQPLDHPRSWDAVPSTPLYKAGERTDPMNYRIIALLTALSKTFDSCLASRLTQWANSVFA